MCVVGGGRIGYAVVGKGKGGRDLTRAEQNIEPDTNQRGVWTRIGV